MYNEKIIISIAGNNAVIFPVILVYSSDWNDTGGALYNAETQMELQGTVEKILPVTWRHGSGTCNGVHVLLKSSDNNLHHVVVGPLWYFRNTITFTEGSIIDIYGSRVSFKNKKYVLAKWIRSGDSEIYLRNYDGSPFWSNDGGNSKMHPPGKGGEGGRPGTRR